MVDHIEPHRGDWTAFMTGDLHSLCEPCHKSAKRQIELRGYRYDLGLDGYPTDPNRPFNRAR
ncbi:MAG: HNH endonuclease [Gammaproteobacteria bacterium]|nr:HNH endonuclease [Gammaproteobacteria bacterium]